MNWKKVLLTGYVEGTRDPGKQRETFLTFLGKHKCIKHSEMIRQAIDRYMWIQLCKAWTSCDSQWQSSEPRSVYIGCFCSLCRVGLDSKQVQHSWWSISQLPCKSSVMSSSVVPMMYLSRPWGYCSYWILSLLRSRCACWMIGRCLVRLLISLGIGPAVAVSPQWVLSDGSWLGVDLGWTSWL